MKPFSLEAAKRGEPIVTRDGTPARFIAHIPEATEQNRVVILIEECVYCNNEHGAYHKEFESVIDLFMAPKKRIRWVNLFTSGASFHYDTKEAANKVIGIDTRIGGKAYPVEIEE